MIEIAAQPLIRDGAQLGREGILDEAVDARCRRVDRATQAHRQRAGREEQRDRHVVADVADDALPRRGGAAGDGLRVAPQLIE
jgi:hypothetical protein